MYKTKIKNYIKQIRGVSYKPADLHNKLDDNSVILLRANNIDDGKINLEDVVYVDKSKVSPEQYLKKGDILICASSGSKSLVGKAARIDFDRKYTFGAFCKVVRPDNAVMDYLGVFFQSPIYRRKISEVAIGANINNIRNEHIDELVFPIYSKNEQQNIVDKFLKIEQIIQMRKQELEKLDVLIKARFMELFGDPETNPSGWAVMRLDDVVTNANNGITRRGSNPGGNIVLRIAELQDGFIDYSDVNRIVVREKEKQCLLVDNDLLFVRVNGNPDYVARSAIFKSIGEPVYHNDHIIRMHIDDNKADVGFIQGYLSTEFGKRQLRDHVKTSAGQYSISQDGIGSIQIYLPPLPFQEQFVAFVRQTNKLKVTIQKSLNETQLLFNSLMQKYFG